MVKGVHKKIIEVRSPGGDYFEKAVFYLRPGVNQLPPEITEAAAQMLLEELQPKIRKKISWKISAAFLLIMLAAAAALCLFVLLM